LSRIVAHILFKAYLSKYVCNRRTLYKYVTTFFQIWFSNWTNCKQVYSYSNVWKWNLYYLKHSKIILPLTVIFIIIIPKVPLRFTSSNQEQISENFHFVILVHTCGIHYQVILLKFIPYFNLKTNLNFKYYLRNIAANWVNFFFYLLAFLTFTVTDIGNNSGRTFLKLKHLI
jgi:hypothetical protein